MIPATGKIEIFGFHIHRNQRHSACLRLLIIHSFYNQPYRQSWYNYKNTLEPYCSGSTARNGGTSCTRLQYEIPFTSDYLVQVLHSFIQPYITPQMLLLDSSTLRIVLTYSVSATRRQTAACKHPVKVCRSFPEQAIEAQMKNRVWDRLD